MNRTDLAKHIRARLEPLAADLADLLLTRIETQIAEVVDVARSALLSEFVPEVAPAAETPQEPSNGRSGAGRELLAPADPPPTIPSGSPAKVNHDPRPRKKAAPRSASGLSPQRPDAPARVEATPITTAAPKKTRGPYTCGKCGAIGFRSDGCGRTHNVADDQDDEPDDAPAPVPFVSRRDRFAAIEQSAAKRTGTLPTPRGTFVVGGGG